MPNNEKNSDYLPNENQNTPENIKTNTNETKPIIEIPQSYYDKLEKERENAIAAEAKRDLESKQMQEAANETEGIIAKAILNAIIIFGSLFATVKISLYLFFVLPVALIGLSIYFSLKDREKNTYPSSIMVGGIIGGVIAFIISVINNNNADLYMYYAIACTILGFAGFAVGSIINKLITKGKEIKALETLGYLLFFVALIGVPYIYAQKNREDFYKLIFHTQVEVKAETEEEFVKKTIKNRYNIEYTCSKKPKNYINEHNRRQIVRSDCTDTKGNNFTITSIAYNEGSNQYVVSDTYLDSILIEPTKKIISEKVKDSTGVTEVTISLYPEKNCFFYGDCVDCDEYYNRYAEENDIEYQYETSTSINFEKYISLDSQKFINDQKFKYIINLYGSFNDNTYRVAVEKTLEALNDNGYKNNYGFIINLYNVIGSDFNDAFKRLAYKVKGDTNSSKLFGDYEPLPVTNTGH